MFYHFFFSFFHFLDTLCFFFFSFFCFSYNNYFQEVNQFQLSIHFIIIISIVNVFKFLLSLSLSYYFCYYDFYLLSVPVFIVFNRRFIIERWSDLKNKNEFLFFFFFFWKFKVLQNKIIITFSNAMYIVIFYLSSRKVKLIRREEKYEVNYHFVKSRKTELSLLKLFSELFSSYIYICFIDFLFSLLFSEINNRENSIQF